MKKSLVSMLILFVIGLQSVLAQGREISGVVTSADDGLSIPGVSVIVKGTTIGTTTDFDGKYSLNVPEDGKFLIFSFVGMTMQEVEISSASLNVVMESESIGMDEVIVTAIGIKKSEKSLGYAATNVKSEELVKARTNNIVEGLQGRVAGVQISNTSGEPGSSTSVVIRGYSSVSGGNEPLYVIDGVPMSNPSVGSSDALNSGFDFGNGANAINPNDVESMTILKGAAATALYGSKASNGAIIITTKAGKSGKMTISYDGSVSISSVLRTPTYQNDFGQGWDGEWRSDENGSWGPKLDGKQRVYGNIVGGERQIKSFVAQENNYRDFWDLGIGHQHALSLSGGDEKTTYLFSYSFADQDGIYPTDADSYKRHTFSMRGSRKMGKFKISSSMNFSTEKVNAVPSGQGLTVANTLQQIPRDFSLVDMEDYKSKFNNIDNYYTPYGVLNPYYVLGEFGSQVNKNKIYGKVQFDYELNDWLNFTYRFGGDVDLYQRKNWNAITKPTAGSNNASTSGTDKGSVYRSHNYTYQINQDFLANFNKDFGKFNLNGTLGFNFNETGRTFLRASVAELDVPGFYNLKNSPSTPSISDYSEQTRLFGAFMTAELSYDNMLYLNLLARNDWSSTLPQDDNSFFYPGATVAFLFTKLLPEKVASVLNLGKVRASYGQTGNDADPYLLNSVFVKSELSNPFRNVKFPLNDQNAFEVGNTLGNKALRPEISTEFEVGADLRFFNNRLGVDVAYYDKKTEDQILDLKLSSATGFTRQTMNLGKVTNKGFELYVYGSPVKTKDFEWKIGVTYSKNESKVVELAEGLDKVLLEGFSGVSMFAKKGYSMGVFETTPLRKTSTGQVIVDAKGLPLDAAAPEVIGSADYDYTAGVTNEFSYKNLDFSFALDIRQGGLMYSRTKSITYFTGNSVETTVNDRNPFVVPNSVTEIKDAAGNVTGYKENSYPITKAEMDGFYNDGGLNGQAGDLIDRSFVKLRNVSLSYRFAESLLNRTPFKEARISLVGNNLLLWTPSSNSFVDPENSTFGSGVKGRFGEYSGAPSVRTFIFSLNLKF